MYNFDKQIIKHHIARTLQERSKKELIYAVIFVLAATTICISLKLDLFEFLYNFSRRHENYELDELIIMFIWIGVAGFIYALRRLNDIRQLTYEITHQALTDSITGLPNRKLSLEFLGSLIERARDNGHKIAVVYLDFDNFKMVNDTYGHQKGDQLIHQFGQSLKYALRDTGNVGRLGGDEFLILIELKDESSLFPLLGSIIELQRKAFNLGANELFIRFSTGVATYPQDGLTPTELLRAADTAMYRSKKEGQGDVKFYTKAMGEFLDARYKLESGLKTAVINDEFYLEYQPQLNLNSNDIIGYEALIRWRKDNKQIPPDEFIHVAEETGMITEIGYWIMNKTMSEVRQFLQPNQLIAINVSPVQLRQNNFVHITRRIAQSHGLSLSQVELEITESALIDDFHATHKKLNELHELGVKIAIDDFGTGYSSLERLQSLPVSRLKIDQSFVRTILSPQPDTGLLAAMMTLAKSLHLDVIAEGVETEAQLQVLQELGCSIMQGFYLSTPLPLERLLIKIKQNNPFYNSISE